jgi:long-chain acyl-CoA synthetase
MSSLSYPNLPLHEVMRATARRYPQHTAIWYNGTSITFSEFDAESNRLANAFSEIGLAKGERLAFYLPNCPQSELSVYAALKLGAVACPINPSYRAFEITHMLKDSGAAIVVTHVTLWPHVEAVWKDLPELREVVLVGNDAPSGLRHVHRYADLMARHGIHAPAAQVSVDDLALLPYSSGTTGRPKGVMLSHRNVVASNLHLAMAGRIGADDVFLVYVPLSHIYGISALMGVAMCAGAEQILLERFDLVTVLRLIEERRVTWLHVVPPVLLTLANTPGLSPEQFRSLKFISNAAAPLVPDVARRVEERLGARIIQSYGLTEASPATHHSPLEPERIKLESVGLPCPDTEARIVDIETGEKTLPPGQIGEVIVRGPQVMQGYWKAPEETARTLRNGWLYTGDIGWVDEDGYTYICDRKKEMIKYKAFSIAPAELESLLLEHPEIADCAVVGVPDDETGQVPKAFVVPRPGTSLDVKALSEFVAGRVANYKQIRQWAIVDRIPRTPSGKILRRSLAAVV